MWNAAQRRPGLSVLAFDLHPLSLPGVALVGKGRGSMTLSRLRWIFIPTSVVFLVVLEWVRHLLYPDLLTWPGRLLLDAVVLVGILFFFGALFEIIARMQTHVERQNRELLALHRASLSIYGDLSLDTVLQNVVDQARSLLDARYGAISVIDESRRIKQFVTSGIDEEERLKVGDPPHGHGLLGVVLDEGQRLRLPDIAHDPRSVGFPPNHPPMRSLLAVPILCNGPFRGNLYLAEKETAAEFSEEDEETLVRLATKASIAIDNAHLHQRLQDLAVAEERLRIAREMHDGMAQVLAYVNTKAQAVKEYLRRGRTEQANDQLEQLAAAAREVYNDAREGILALRTPVGPGHSLPQAVQDFLERWQDQSGIAGELRVGGAIELAPAAELQLLRIIQEALSNVRKHSRASRTTVALCRNGHRVVAEVVDDGEGFDPSARSRGDLPRFGLAIMRERAESIGGSLEIDSIPGEGTRVRIELPLS